MSGRRAPLSFQRLTERPVSTRPDEPRGLPLRGPSHRSRLVPTLALAVVLTLLTVGGLGAATGTTQTMVAPNHAAPAHAVTPSALLADARSSSARGQGPGAVATPAAPSHLTSGPNLTFGVSMAYDAADGYVLAVSLNATGGPYNNTYAPNELSWKFSAGNWTLIATTGHVPATLGPALVDDAKDDYVLLYGGRLMATGATNAPVTNQTWSYHAGVWSNLSANSTAAPTAVDFPNLVYDGYDQYVLLYDELGLSGSPNGTLETTWSYASGVWTNLTATAGAPPAGWFGAMTYDANDQYVVYFGGFTLSDQLTNSTYTFHGGVWSNVSGTVVGAPSPRMNFGFTYDSSTQQALLYGGLVQLYDYNASAFSGETWSYANGTWALLASNGSVYNSQGMVYDAADNETVLLGSNLSDLVTNNLTVVTWAFSGTTWAVAAPVFGPLPIVMDTGQSITLQVTESPNDGGLSYTYAGLPPGCLSMDTAQLVCVPQSQGMYHVVVTILGAAGYVATARTTLEVNPAPAILQVGTTHSLGEVGVSMELNVTASFGTGSLTYSYSGLPSGCVSANTPLLTCVPQSSGSFSVAAVVTDSLGVSSSPMGISFSVAPALTVTAVTANHPAIDVGQLLSVATSVAGGVGQVNFALGGLPAGCVSTNQGSASCRPSTTGTFGVFVSATDSLGAVATSTALLTVNPLPSVGSFLVSSASVPAGGAVQLTASVAGGTGPFSYAYRGLPTGCVANGGPTVACSATASGEFTVIVTVTDATGATANATTEFTVGASPGPGMSPSQGPAWLGGSAFLWGLAAGIVGIAIAGIVGGNRLRLSRQGEQIVRDLHQEDSDLPTPIDGATEPPVDTEEPRR